eukprot:4746042-Pyramimonas_sp.AAC.1
MEERGIRGAMGSGGRRIRGSSGAWNGMFLCSPPVKAMYFEIAWPADASTCPLAPRIPTNSRTNPRVKGSSIRDSPPLIFRQG